jgi:hypothetical protein
MLKTALNVQRYGEEVDTEFFREDEGLDRLRLTKARR